MSQTPPQIDISIKWKLLALVLAVYVLPIWLILAAGASPVILLAVGLVLVGGVTCYIWNRVAHTVSHLQTRLDRLDPHGFTPARKTTFNDELSALVHSYDQLVTNLEETLSEANAPEAQGQVEVADAEAAAPTRQSVFKAGLSTGDPVVGEAIVMPRHRDEDMATVSRLKGSQAMTVFRQTLMTSLEELAELRETQELGVAESGIIDFQLMLLQDEALVHGVEQCIEDGLNLTEALTTSFALIVGKIESSPNAYLKARATDFHDLKQRLLDNLFRQMQPEVNEFYANAKNKVVFCESIYPTVVVALYKAGALGIVSIQGTASSHAEILLQSFNMPSLTNIEGLPIYVVNGRQTLIDTVNKTLIIDPTPEEIQNLTQPTTFAHEEVIKEPVRLASGELVRVLATINNVTIESRRALLAGADGVGLFRSEMSYIGRPDLPDEEELYNEYRVLTDTFSDQPVAMRMLDLGSDKLAIFQHDDEREENPCMGNRSMRLLIRRPHIFRTQLRAMLRATTRNTCILFPMISGWYELEKVQALIRQTIPELANEGYTRLEDVKYGIMVEIPGIATRFEDYVDDFAEFNIGANDLTQYTLAADRNNRNVADYYDFYHPAVLTLLEKVCRIGAERGKVVRLCGEMSGDVEMLPLLIGLGMREFSTHYFQIARIKQTLRTLDATACRELATACLRCRSASEVRKTVNQYRHTQPKATP